MAATILERFDNALAVGNRTASISISTDLSLGIGSTINNLIDGGFSQNSVDSVEFNSGQTGKYILFDFGAGNEKSIKSFVWYKSNTSGHGNFKLQASNDNATWVDIVDAVSTSPLIVIGDTNGLNLGFYRYFRLLQTSGSTSTSPWNEEIEFRLYDQHGADDRAAVAPSYANFLGTGKRDGYITIKGTTTWQSSGSIPSSAIVNGSQSNEVWFTGGQTGTYIEFDFFADYLITEIKWYQNSSVSHGTWKWQHFDEDTSTWVDVGSSFTLGGVTTQTITTMSGATTYHRKYRLQQVSGSTSSSPFIREIEFKVGSPAISSDTITSLSPSVGITTGGTPVTITGKGFTGATDVTFGGLSASSVVVVSDTSITCVTPAHTAGTVDVVVVKPGPDITKLAAFTYSSVPSASVTSVTPNSGDTSGGTVVTIVGDNFTGATGVTFDGIAATSVVVVDDEHITCITPAGSAGAADVVVHGLGGDGTLADGFTYILVISAIVTQAPLLVVSLPHQPTVTTQVPLLVVFKPIQDARVTQVPITVAYQTTPIPLPLPIVPEIPVKETWEWKTAITIADGSKEQRASLIANPRIGMKFSAIILSQSDRRDVYQMLFKYLSREFPYPLYLYSTKLQMSALVGDTKLYFDPSSTDMRNGEQLALFDPTLSKTYYTTILTVDADGVTLSTPLSVAPGVDWLVCPAITFRSNPNVGLRMANISGDFSLELLSIKVRSILRPEQLTTLTTFDGYVVLDKHPLANEEVEENFNQNIDWLDNDIAPPLVYNDWPIPFINGARQYLVHRPEGLDYWRAFADAIKGQRLTFLVPTFYDDLPLSEIPALNAITIKSTNIQLLDFWRSTAYRYIRIKRVNGKITYNRIVEVTGNYDTNGELVTLNITLSTSIGALAGDNIIEQISYANLCRLNSDIIELEHLETDTILTLNIRVVQE